jgi:hypothetical protein
MSRPDSEEWDLVAVSGLSGKYPSRSRSWPRTPSETSCSGPTGTSPWRTPPFVGSLVDRDVGAHAIINASNPDLRLGGGVSGAIRDACGVTFQREIRERWEEQYDQPLEPDDCLVTSAGSASWLRCVLHVAAVDHRRPDPETGGPSGPSWA